VGGLAFFAVCGLLAAALAVFALNIYDLVETLAQDRGDGGLFGDRLILSSGLESILWQSGVLVAAALAVYLLAPPADDAETQAEPPPRAPAAPGSAG
jgi:hypothetical protein